MSVVTKRTKREAINSLILGPTLLTATGADINLATGMAAQGVTSIPKVVKVPLGVAAAAGGAFAWANPEPGAVFVTRVVIDVTTVATAAGTLSVGQAANGTTSAANLIDTLDVHTAAGSFDSVANPGSGGKPLQKVAAGAFVTGSKASGSLTGLVGNAYIHYFSA